MAEAQWYRMRGSSNAVKALQVTKETLEAVKTLLGGETAPVETANGAIFEFEGTFRFIKLGDFVVQYSKTNFDVIDELGFGSQFDSASKPVEKTDLYTGFKPISSLLQFHRMKQEGAASAEAASGSPSPSGTSSSGPSGSAGTGPSGPGSSGVSEPGG